MADLAKVQVWAEALIRMHLDESWSFGFDHAKKRAGACNFRDKRITVSRYLSARYDDDTVHQTLLHEVAHAVAGHKAGHGPEWKRVADDLGYVGGRTHDGEVAAEFAKWVGVCPNGHEVLRFRRPQRGRLVSCLRCAPAFDRRFLIQWRERSDAERHG